MYKLNRTYNCTTNVIDEFATRNEAIEALVQEMAWLDHAEANTNAYFFGNAADVDSEIEFWSEDQSDDRAKAIIDFLRAGIPTPCLVSYDDPEVIASIDLSEDLPSFRYDTKKFWIEKTDNDE